MDTSITYGLDAPLADEGGWQKRAVAAEGRADAAEAELASLKTAYVELEALYAASTALTDALSDQLESRAPLVDSLRATIATLSEERAAAHARSSALLAHIRKLGSAPPPE